MNNMNLNNMLTTVVADLVAILLNFPLIFPSRALHKMDRKLWLTTMVPFLVAVLEKFALTLVILVLILNDLFRYLSTAMDNTAKAVLTTLQDVRQDFDEQVRPCQWALTGGPEIGTTTSTPR